MQTQSGDDNGQHRQRRNEQQHSSAMGRLCLGFDGRERPGRRAPPGKAVTDLRTSRRQMLGGSAVRSAQGYRRHHRALLRRVPHRRSNRSGNLLDWVRRDPRGGRRHETCVRVRRRPVNSWSSLNSWSSRGWSSPRSTPSAVRDRAMVGRQLAGHAELDRERARQPQGRERPWRPTLRLPAKRRRISRSSLLASPWLSPDNLGRLRSSVTWLRPPKQRPRERCPSRAT